MSSNDAHNVHTAFEQYTFVACVHGRFRNVKSLINWKWREKKEKKRMKWQRNWYKRKHHHCKTYRNMCATQTNISIKSQKIIGTKKKFPTFVVDFVTHHFEIEFVENNVRNIKERSSADHIVSHFYSVFPFY